ncbi:metal-binding protein [Neobacillus sp.]|uniref:metal-binding protein n=1 Tax=Neobacillus sp. TaxID=2675273 RepID=UPI00289B76D2|nr:metal-binding protein [Neobacillus sp.]
MNGIDESFEKKELHKVYTLMRADKQPYESEILGTFGGHRQSEINRRIDCPVAFGAINKCGYIKHRGFFADEQTAISAGFRPCGVCMPEKYAIWKKQ